MRWLGSERENPGSEIYVLTSTVLCRLDLMHWWAETRDLQILGLRGRKDLNREEDLNQFGVGFDFARGLRIGEI